VSVKCIGLHVTGKDGALILNCGEKRIGTNVPVPAFAPFAADSFYACQNQWGIGKYRILVWFRI
jgi:hypothetical protein